MLTPWGDSENLRERRLPRGSRGRSETATRAHQRERLFAALVATVAERGYADADIIEVAHRAGVGKRTAYEQFPGAPKRDCLLAAVDELYAEAVRRVGEACAAPAGWEEGLRAGLTALLELIAEQPAAARACVVEVYATGAPGGARVEDALARFEDLLRARFAECPSRAALPAEVSAAAVGALSMVIHDRVRERRVAELPGMAAEMLAWVLSYEAPAGGLPGGGGATAGRAGTTGAFGAAAAGAVPADERGRAGTPRERLLRAIAAAVGEHGYEGVKLGDLARRARTSLTTLYDEFGGKEGLFLAAFDTICERSFEVCAKAYQEGDDWPLKMHAVNRRLFDYLAAEAGFARTVLVDVLGAGATALEHRARALEPFRQLLAEGYALNPAAPRPAAEAIVYAVYSLAGRRVARDGPAALPRLASTATYLELAPFVGARRAAEVARLPAAGA